jgi:hypothetical protein
MPGSGRLTCLKVDTTPALQHVPSKVKTIAIFSRDISPQSSNLTDRPKGTAMVNALLANKEL